MLELMRTNDNSNGDKQQITIPEQNHYKFLEEIPSRPKWTCLKESKMLCPSGVSWNKEPAR